MINNFDSSATADRVNAIIGMVNEMNRIVSKFPDRECPLLQAQMDSIKVLNAATADLCSNKYDKD